MKRGASLRIFFVIAIALMFCGSAYDDGYQHGWDGASPDKLKKFLSKDYERGYEEGADDAWYYDKGCYDAENGFAPKSDLEDDPDYMEGYNDCG